MAVELGTWNPELSYCLSLFIEFFSTIFLNGTFLLSAQMQQISLLHYFPFNDLIIDGNSL